MRLMLPYGCLALLLLETASLASAEPRLPRQTEPLPPSSAAKLPKANPCAAFGAGFVRAEGTDTCVKVGGSVSVGTSVRGR